MKGNFHVQFLGEGVAATSPPYPTLGWATTQVYPARGPPPPAEAEVRDRLICLAPLIPFADSLFSTLEKLESLVAVHVFVP